MYECVFFTYPKHTFECNLFKENIKLNKLNLDIKTFSFKLILIPKAKTSFNVINQSGKVIKFILYLICEVIKNCLYLHYICIILHKMPKPYNNYSVSVSQSLTHRNNKVPSAKLTTVGYDCFYVVLSRIYNNSYNIFLVLSTLSVIFLIVK